MCAAAELPSIDEEATDPAERPDLVVGIIAPVGVNTGAVVEALTQDFSAHGYQSVPIRVSDALLETAEEIGWQVEGDSRYDRLMTLGTELRTRAGDGGVTAMIAIAAIKRLRDELDADQPKAFILRSLKHKDEIVTLRQVYGSRFLLVACTCAESDRRDRLSDLLTQEGLRQGEALVHAEYLVQRDQAEHGQRLGQQVRRAFPEADVFIDTSQRPPETSRDFRRHLTRSIELWFGHPFRTPTSSEMGMYHAHTASLRSAALGRQVGCAITDDLGEIVSAGANEVPKAGGGQYWTDDLGDARDFRLEQEPADRHNKVVLADLLQRMGDAGWLNRSESLQQLVEEAIEGPASQARILDLLEFGRVVHAEMAALMSASRRGVAVGGCDLYTTTFPCHECARHIVAAGIRKVEYREPYPKSLTTSLYRDSVAVDAHEPGKVSFIPFVGIAPRLFPLVFQAPERKGPGGVPRAHDRQTAWPRLAERDRAADEDVQQAEDDILVDALGPILEAIGQ